MKKWLEKSFRIGAVAWRVASDVKEKRIDDHSLVAVGWREWLSLPELGIPAIKAKMDTGARTSSLHTYAIETFRDHGVEKVRFGIHPLQKRRDVGLICTADVVDRRFVTDSGGRREFRYVICSPVSLGNTQWPAIPFVSAREFIKKPIAAGQKSPRLPRGELGHI